MSIATRLRIAVSLLLVTLVASVSNAADAAAPDRPNVLLIVLDTLRFDATSFGDPQKANTPFLESLASRSVVFTRVYSTFDYTPPSHFTLLTGLHDGLDGPNDRTEHGLPYQLAKTGYDTFDTTANTLLTTSLMTTFRGFARHNEVPSFILPMGELGALQAVDMRLAMFRLHRNPHNRTILYYDSGRMLPMFAEQVTTAKQPFFGFANLMDPHDPYAPDPQTYAPETNLPANFDGDIVARRPSTELLHPETIKDPQRREYVKGRLAIVGSPGLVAIDLTPEARAIYRRRYDAKVRAADAKLKEFFAALDREHLLDNTIIIITSDHGESFGEADLMTHNFLNKGDYESTHHVPLIIVLPPRFRVTSRLVDARISSVDLAPTIYDLTGIDDAPMAKAFKGYGKSLVPLFSATPIPDVATVALPTTPKPPEQDTTEERKKALRSLGYIH